MPAALDALIVGLYASIDDFLGPRHRGPGRPPKLTDAELITLAVAQVLLGHLVIADENLAGAEFEQLMAQAGATFLRPDRRNEPRRNRSLGAVRQWIESTFWTCKGQLGLEHHGARTLPGLGARIGLRLLALAAGIWHNHLAGQPARAFANYGR